MQFLGLDGLEQLFLQVTGKRINWNKAGNIRWTYRNKEGSKRIISRIIVTVLPFPFHKKFKKDSFSLFLVSKYLYSYIIKFNDGSI